MSSFKIKPPLGTGEVDSFGMFSLYDIEIVDDDSPSEESDEIKPCPFCGKIPQLRAMSNPIHHNIEMLSFKCYACETEMSIVLNGRSNWEAFEELQKKWNRRA